MREPPSVQDVIERDRRDEYAKDAAFDDALWLALCRRIVSPEAAAELPEPVWVYYATRFMQWEVGNGGFAQAAMNIPQWFELAARGNEILGKPHLAALIREAQRRARRESERLARARAGGVESAFAYFREGTFRALDRQLDAVGWWCDAARIAYVRAHRATFLEMDEAG